MILCQFDQLTTRTGRMMNRIIIKVLRNAEKGNFMAPPRGENDVDTLI